jgi:hypothetical protein
MRTPAGSECKHYYEDFNRGREIQQCRLARLNPASLAWLPGDCAKCSAPAILRANSSPDMTLTLTIKRGFLGIGRRVELSAFCSKHMTAIDEPPVGCLQCNAERPSLEALFGERNS